MHESQEVMWIGFGTNIMPMNGGRIYEAGIYPE